MAKIEKKSFSDPDEVRTPSHSRIEEIRLGNQVFMRATFEPGWRWSQDIKPIAGTESCMVHHTGFLESGHLKTLMDDGTEIDAVAGDVVDIPAGHDGWVVGDEPAVFIDIAGGATYAK